MRLVVAVLMLAALVPSVVQAADNDTWAYPTSTPKKTFSGGSGTSSDPYLIGCAQDLADLSYLSQRDEFKGVYFRMTRDIVLNKDVLNKDLKRGENGTIHYVDNKAHFDNLQAWEQIGGEEKYLMTQYFKGIFDGDGHSISGLYVHNAFHSAYASDFDDKFRRVGLFANCKNARISNLTIKDSYYTVLASINLDPKGVEFLSGTSVGGIVGYAENTSITNCHLENCVIAGDGTVLDVPTYCVGGIVGNAQGASVVVSGCSYNGVIESYVKSNYADYSHLSRVDRFMSVTGGIVGYCLASDNAVISNCHTNGTLIMHQIDQLNRSTVGAGGIVGYIGESEKLKTTIRKCTNRMAIHAFDEPDYSVYVAEHVAVGGISACRAVCVDCINFGDIAFLSPQSTSVGKNFLGWAQKYSLHGICEGGRATYCINYGTLTFGHVFNSRLPQSNTKNIYVNIGGIMSADGTITRCYNDNSDLYCMDSYRYLLYAFDPISPSASATVSECQHYTMLRTSATATAAKTQSRHAGAVSRDNSLDFRHNAVSLASDLNKQFGGSMFGVEPNTTRWGDNAYHGYLSFTSVGAVAAELDGEGSETSPYCIWSEADLRAMQKLIKDEPAVYAGKCYKLCQNINMTDSEPMPMIGQQGAAFTGHFDGNGCFIRGINLQDGCLFYGVARGTADGSIGRVERLALLDVRYPATGDYYGTIARWVGNSTGGEATIEDCYVEGNITADIEGRDALVGGICSKIYKGSAVRNCAYMGNVTIKSYGSTVALIGGIAATTDGTVSHCTASWHYDNTLGDAPMTVGSIVAGMGDGSTVTSAIGAFRYNRDKYTKLTCKDDDLHITNRWDEYLVPASDLNGVDEEAHWIQGRYSAVLKNAYHYDCKDHNGNDVALLPVDRTPIEIHNSEKKYNVGCNDILTLTPTQDQLATDTKMWQLANLAVYREDQNADIVTDLRLTSGTNNGYDASAFGYKPSHEGAALLGAATYKIGVKTGSNWYSVCLPGCVEKADLPTGFKLYVGGKLADNVLNIVEVDSVPAGVPFLMHYTKAADSVLGDSVTIHMTGTLMATPQKVAESSALTGTYAVIEGNENLRCVVEEDTDGTLRLVKRLVDKRNTATGAWTYNVPQVPVFAAYADNAADVVLDTRLLLDEQSDDIEGTLDEYDGKTVHVVMHRTIRGNGWNTVCLPFDVDGRNDLAKVLGCGDPESTFIEELSKVEYDAANNMVVFKFASNPMHMSAGNPYLVSAAIADKSILDFGEREIKNTATPAECPVSGLDLKVAMVGSLPKVIVQSSDEKNAYFLQANTFYRATSSSPVLSPGFRCWFSVTNASGTGAALLQTARIVHADGSTTDIRLIDRGTAPDGSRIYDMQGMEHSGMVHGVNIVGGKKIFKK